MTNKKSPDIQNINDIDSTNSALEKNHEEAINMAKEIAKTQNDSEYIEVVEQGYALKYVVGIGASAGGLEALEQLFANMPMKTGMAFIVVQHLSPDYKSMMDELLARKTMIDIKVVTDQMVIEADTIYLIPPKKEMITANGRLYLTERETNDGINLPINTFFRSLAETYQDKSVAVVLSGTGSDGSKGITQVHDAGGLVIAQTPESCKFSAMPENAIKTNHVDLVIDPIEIPSTLIKYSQRTQKIEQQLNLGQFDAGVAEFSEILILLNNRFDLDFSQYKPSTITRRLERRVSMQNTPSLKDYINVVLSNHEELEALYYDLLIGVTQFFRDPVAFASLRSRIPKLLQTFKDEAEIRIWVTACASGQEAYTMSMMMTEAMENDPNGNKPFKIFATDIHNKSIQFAAAGIYNEEEIQTMEPHYRDRFFQPLAKGKYQVTPEIRKPIVFAQHNLLKDPPFTRTHLVSCRNLLIYFNTAAQQRVMTLLSFSLLNQGLLFLGPSEAIGGYSSDFGVIDTTNKLFRKTRTSERRLDVPLTLRSRPPMMNSDANKPQEKLPLSAKSQKAKEALLQEYVPTSLLVDDKGDILHIFGDAGKFLTLSFGSATLNLRGLVDGQAKVVITQMLHHIGRNHKPLRTKNVTGFASCDTVNVSMRVLSELPSDLEYIIVSLEEVSVVDEKNQEEILLLENSETLVSNYKDTRIKELEEELSFANESLQTTVEELETSNEELQASNEELMASNEELQSTNEELQSVNEELFTVNAEFQQKEVEREQLIADEDSIISESGIGILFLDRELKIRKFSPQAAKLLNLIDTDYGRPFSAISGSIIKNVKQDIIAVYDGGYLIEKEVIDEDGSVFLMRITARQDPIIKEVDTDTRKAIVVTFTNVTKMQATQAALEKTQERLNHTLNAISDSYFEWVPESGEAYFSPAFYEKLGYEDTRPTFEKLLGSGFEDFKRLFDQAHTNNTSIEEPFAFICQNGDIRWMVCKGDVFVNETNQQTKLVGITIDFNQQKANEIKLQEQTVELERSNEFLEKFAYIVSHDLKAPIRHIKNYLLFLQDAINNDDKVAMAQEMLGINDSATGLSNLVDDIITYARVTSEKKKLVDVDLNIIIKNIEYTLEPIINEKNITIRHDEMPLIQGDKTLLNHLMQNLIGNACKYNLDDKPLIEVSHVIEHGNCIITIKDNGIGFDEAQAQSIFEPFKRLVTKDHFEGSGIGLSICKTVVDQHNGKIWATSVLGEGSSFVVTLPLHK